MDLIFCSGIFVDALDVKEQLYEVTATSACCQIELPMDYIYIYIYVCFKISCLIQQYNRYAAL